MIYTCVKVIATSDCNNKGIYCRYIKKRVWSVFFERKNSYIFSTGFLVLFPSLALKKLPRILLRHHEKLNFNPPLPRPPCKSTWKCLIFTYLQSLWRSAILFLFSSNPLPFSNPLSRLWLRWVDCGWGQRQQVFRKHLWYKMKHEQMNPSTNENLTWTHVKPFYP